MSITDVVLICIMVYVFGYTVGYLIAWTPETELRRKARRDQRVRRRRIIRHAKQSYHLSLSGL